MINFISSGVTFEHMHDAQDQFALLGIPFREDLLTHKE
jgi:hypothetical protein